MKKLNNVVFLAKKEINRLEISFTFFVTMWIHQIKCEEDHQ